MRQMRGHFYAALYTARTGFSAAEQQRPKKLSPESQNSGLVEF
jgi:hypothetical protein